MDGFDLGDLALFAQVAGVGSLAGAEQTSGVPKATLSRVIVRLEEAAGGRLFDRLPRGLRLTALGEALLPVAQRARALRQEAVDVVRAAEGEPRGLVRIAATFLLGHRLVAPALADILTRYPLLRIELTPRNDPVDVLAEGFDLSVGPYRPTRAGVVVRQLAEPPLGLFAAPLLIDRHGPIERPEDVRKLGRIVVAAFDDHEAWTLGKDGDSVRVDDPPVAAVLDPAAAAEFAASGRGVVKLPRFLARDYVKANRLVAVLPLWRGPKRPLWASLPEGRGAVPAVRVCLDAMAAFCAKQPSEWLGDP